MAERVGFEPAAAGGDGGIRTLLMLAEREGFELNPTSIAPAKASLIRSFAPPILHP